MVSKKTSKNDTLIDKKKKNDYVISSKLWSEEDKRKTTGQSNRPMLFYIVAVVYLVTSRQLPHTRAVLELY